MQRRFPTLHIVDYRCDDCRAGHTRPVGEHTEGLCPGCGAPMRIADVFGDRRFVSIPVLLDRRHDQDQRAA